MTQPKESPAHGDSRAQGDNKTRCESGYLKALEAATEAILEDSKADDFNAKAYYKGLPTIAYLFRITLADARSIFNATKPKAKPARFIWLEAINRRRDLGVRALRIANAIFLSTGAHGYCWPSQSRLADLAGYEDPAEVRRGLSVLIKLGMLRSIKIYNLPKHLSEIALSPLKQNGSGRSLRGAAYCIVTPTEWEQHEKRTSCPSNMRDTESLHNRKSNLKLLRNGIPTQSSGSSSDTLQNVGTFIQGADPAELDSYIGGLNG